MKITDLSLRRPVTVIVVCLALAVLGIFSLGRLAIDMIPDISFPVIVIYTSYPGVSPEEVEENLTKTIENAAASASRVEKISSTSSEGSSFVIVEYQWGTDLADASNDLRERLDLIRDYIPDEATQPVLFKFDPSMAPDHDPLGGGPARPGQPALHRREHGQDQPGADRRGGQRGGGRRGAAPDQRGPEPGPAWPPTA